MRRPAAERYRRAPQITRGAPLPPVTSAGASSPAEPHNGDRHSDIGRRITRRHIKPRAASIHRRSPKVRGPRHATLCEPSPMQLRSARRSSAQRPSSVPAIFVIRHLPKHGTMPQRGVETAVSAFDSTGLVRTVRRWSPGRFGLTAIIACMVGPSWPYACQILRRRVANASRLTAARNFQHVYFPIVNKSPAPEVSIHDQKCRHLLS